MLSVNQLPEFERLLRKFIRFPWEVWQGHEHCKDSEISNYVAHHAYAGTAFREEPKTPEERLRVLYAMANVLVISFNTQGGDALEERNRFKTLPQEEKDYLFNTLGINRKDHDSILYIVKKGTEATRLASYAAAAYAFTTFTKPFVLNFERLTSIALTWAESSTPEVDTIKCAGLFILTDLGFPTKINETVYAFLQNMLYMRNSVRRMNVFFDTPHGIVMEKYNRRKRPTRDDVVDTYMNMFPLSYRIDNNLVGLGVHMPFIDEN